MNLTQYTIAIFFYIFGACVGAFAFNCSAHAQSLTPYGMWDYTRPEAWVPDWRTQTIPQQQFDPGPQTAVIPEEPEIVDYPNGEEPGTVIVSQAQRRLYYVIDADSALEYPIGVGRNGFQWTGVQKVSRIVEWPEWIPPAEMRARRPELPVRMAGGVKNPLGAVAIYLGNTLYRIHGSNEPKTIGTESSSGCFRMHNEHAVHLASLVHVGTVVKVY